MGKLFFFKGVEIFLFLALLGIFIGVVSSASLHKKHFEDKGVILRRLRRNVEGELTDRVARVLKSLMTLHLKQKAMTSMELYDECFFKLVNINISAGQAHRECQQFLPSRT